MTRPLRKLHAAIWVILPVLLLAVLVAGLLARRPTTPANLNFRWGSVR